MSQSEDYSEDQEVAEAAAELARAKVASPRKRAAQPREPAHAKARGPAAPAAEEPEKPPKKAAATKKKPRPLPPSYDEQRPVSRPTGTSPAPKPVRGTDVHGTYYRSGRSGLKCYYTVGDYDSREAAQRKALKNSGYD